MDDLIVYCHVIGIIVTSSGVYDCSMVLQAQKLAFCIKIPVHVTMLLLCNVLLSQAKTTTVTHLGEDYDSLMTQVAGNKGTATSCEDMRNCFFGDYMDSSKAPEERNYAEVVDVPALISTMEGYLVDHNGQSLFYATASVDLHDVLHRPCETLIY